ncbi:MAG TPA: DUF5719 family protein, partial [Actinotalea sp.]|nr:DUF5719 family protein [Actinotalea sp.]
RLDLVCAGPPRLSAADEGLSYDPGFDPAPEGTATTTTVLTVGRDGPPAATARFLGALAPTDATVTALEPEAGAASTATVSGAAGPGVLQAEPVDGATALAAGATLARTDAGDLRGLVGATCQEAAASAWIVGGSTQLGSSARLVLDNAGATPATVTLTAWGAAGPLDPGQAGTVLVPAGSERAVLLESFAAEQARVALHLTVAGGQVAAWLQDSALRGFTPAGVDLGVPAAEPATTVVVPGVVLEESAIGDADPTVLRVLNPNPEATTVALRLLGPDGEVTIPGAEEARLEPGSVTDISLAGVPAGEYAAELSAAVPITASAMLTRVGSPLPDDPDQPVVDRAWTAAAQAATSFVVVVPGERAVGAAVVLTNPGDAAVTAELRPVTADGEVGEVGTLRVPARSTAVVEPEALSGAVALEVSVPETGGPADADGAAAGGGAGGLLGAAVLTAEAPDGTLITVLGAQRDLQASQTVAVRLAQP